MSADDWKEMRDEFKSFRDGLDTKVDKEDCKGNHEGDGGLSRAVQKNTTDINWLKWGQRLLLTGLIALGLAAGGLAAGGLT